MRLLAMLILLCSAGSVSAQYEVPWFKMAGGGGTSNSISWRVSGTIGQVEPDLVPLCSQDGVVPGLCEGATYQLEGGFWVPASRKGISPSCGSDLSCIFRDGFETSL